MCIEIAEKIYGPRLNHMKPDTIVNLIEAMMRQQTTYKGMREDCEAEVQEWCNTF